MASANKAPKQAFSILKVPVSREKQVLYYYRPYVADTENMPALASPPPPERTLYIVHFL